MEVWALRLCLFTAVVPWVLLGAQPAARRSKPVSLGYQQYLDEALHSQAVLRKQENALQDGDGRLKRLLDSSQPASLRIQVVYRLEGSTFLHKQQQDRLQYRLLPGAVAVIQKYLKVRIPRKAPIRVSPPGPKDPGTCLEAKVQELWNGPGFSNTDLVIYVTALDTPACSGDAMAYSSPCVSDPVTGRPLVAGLNICPLFPKMPSAQNPINTLAHELMHSLGFTSQLLPVFFDQSTGLRYSPNQVVTTVRPGPQQGVQEAGKKDGSNSGGGRAATYLSTPRIKALAQDHFGCPGLPGAPADLDSNASHLRQRMFGGELMIPTTTQDGREKLLTNFTLAFMEDTGWYVADKSQAQHLPWGYKAGCSFVYNSCTAYAKEQPDQDYFCSEKQRGAAVCVQDHMGFAMCGVGPGERCLVAAVHSNFGPALMCGSQPEYARQDRAFITRTTSYQRSARPFGGVLGSGNSRCYQLLEPACHTGSVGGARCLNPMALCYETRCDGSGLAYVRFRFEDGRVEERPCPTGTVINLPELLPNYFSKGKLQCPNNSVVCNTLSCGSCFNGQCHKGRCLCNMEFTGPSCTQSLIPR